MTVDKIRQKYLDFFTKKHNHKLIPPAPLIPPDDPTTLFTSSGMQQLEPYLKGQSHPMGNRLVNSQPCFRAQDINEVGNNRHTTFFEMLGNWSLGDYFKKEQLQWFWQFLTKELSLPAEKLHVTLFEGNQEIPQDKESFQIYRDLGVLESHIHYYDSTENWWSRSGTPDQMPPGEIGGPDSEIFYDFGKKLKLHEKSIFKDQKCHPNCDCGRFLEIGNSVFMQYEKQADGSFKSLPQENVDFGGGLERLAMAANNQSDIFQLDIFKPIIKEIESACNKKYQTNKKSMRIIADHLRASVFLIAAGVIPSNKDRGYILRRLIRRILDQTSQSLSDLAFTIVDQYHSLYPELKINSNLIKQHLNQEQAKYNQTIQAGKRALDKLDIKDGQISGQQAFDLFQSHGLSLPTISKLAPNYQAKVDVKGFKKAFQSHQQQSRTASKGMFKGGLAEHSEEITKLHTATHLLHQALRDILGDHVNQKGSNITNKRLRFDFSHPQALTPQEIDQIESLVNQKIKADLPVIKTTEDKTTALKSGALAFFSEAYPDKVDVYTISDYSKEICGGPHVKSTGQINKIKIFKQKSASAGVRRLYAKLAS